MSEIRQCVGCGNDFTLTDEDLDFFNREITDKETGEKLQMKPPRRCSACRRKKREQNKK